MFDLAAQRYDLLQQSGFVHGECPVLLQNALDHHGDGARRDGPVIASQLHDGSAEEPEVGRGFGSARNKDAGVGWDFRDGVTRDAANGARREHVA